MSRLDLQGVAELREALRRLPDELASEGANIVEDTTDEVHAALFQAYPPPGSGRTGNLRSGVKSKVVRNEEGAIGEVSSTSPHSYIWNFGTAIRATRQGWNRGRSPSHKSQGLIPIAIRARRKMVDGLIALVRRAGLQVNG